MAICIRFILQVRCDVVHESVDMVLATLQRVLVPYVKFPSTVEQCEELAANFAQRNGMYSIASISQLSFLQQFYRRPQKFNVWINVFMLQPKLVFYMT